MSINPQQERSSLPFFLCAVIAQFGVLLYLQSTNFGFVYDDYLQITYNPQVSDSTRSVSAILGEPTPPGNLYRPLTTISYALTERLFGLAPLPFHIFNIVLYGLICGLALPFIWLSTHSKRAAVVGAILFAVLPIHVEAVANIIGRAEMLSTLFALIAFFLVRKAALSTRSFAISFFSLVGGACYLCGILSKESSLPLALPIILGAWLSLDRSVPAPLRIIRIFTPSSVLLVCAAAGLWMRYLALGSNFIIEPDGKLWVENPLFNEPFIARILPSLALLGRYILNTLIPIGLSADYSSTPSYFYSWLASSEGIIAISILIIASYLLLRSRDTRALLLTVWFVSAFSLTINLITPIGTLMGDRLAFAPSLAVCGIFGLTVDYLTTRIRSLTLVFTSLYLAFLAYLTVLRLPVWKSNDSLFTQTVIDAPYSPKAWYNLGVERVLKDPSSKEGEEYFRKSLELYPQYLLPTKAMADIMLARKDYGRLEYWYRAVLALDPSDQTVQENLNKLLAR